MVGLVANKIVLGGLCLYLSNLLILLGFF